MTSQGPNRCTEPEVCRNGSTHDWYIISPCLFCVGVGVFLHKIWRDRLKVATLSLIFAHTAIYIVWQIIVSSSITKQWKFISWNWPNRVDPTFNDLPWSCWEWNKGVWVAIFASFRWKSIRIKDFWILPVQRMVMSRQRRQCYIGSCIKRRSEEIRWKWFGFGFRFCFCLYTAWVKIRCPK